MGVGGGLYLTTFSPSIKGGERKLGIEPMLSRHFPAQSLKSRAHCPPATRVHCCFTSTDTIGTIRDGEPRTATSTFTQFLSSVIVQRCFTSTETTRTVKDGEPRTATSTFTQFLLLSCCFTSTESIKTIRDGEPRTATDLDFHTAPSSFVLLYVHRNYKA